MEGVWRDLGIPRDKICPREYVTNFGRRRNEQGSSLLWSLYTCKLTCMNIRHGLLEAEYISKSCSVLEPSEQSGRTLKYYNKRSEVYGL